MHRYHPAWRDTQPAVQETQPAELTALEAPADQRHQVCPPCTGNCKQGDACSADRPQDAGEWSMVAFILLVLAAALILGPMVQGMLP